MRLPNGHIQPVCLHIFSLFLVAFLALSPDSFAQTPISFVQVASATPQSPAATLSVSYPRAQNSGDLNVVVVGWNDTTAKVQSVKDSAGNTYHLAIGPTIGTQMQQSIYYAANIASGSNAVTVTFSQAAAYPDVRILEYRGVTTLDVTAGASGNSSTASSGAATTRSANELIFGANTVATMTAAAGSGFTSRMITSPDGDVAEDKAVTAVGSNSATSTLSSAGPWVMQMAAFSAVAVSSPAPTVSSVSPNSGSTAGGTAVTITGANFAAGAAVKFGGTAATNVAVVNSTTITATTPASSVGAAAVTVTNSGGQSGSLASAFSYTSVAPTPVFSLAAGSYTTAQSVTISDSMAGAAIYYTTNGTTPTTSSTKYAGAITVSATETIKAIAVAPGYTNSAVSSATYTIYPKTATPVLSLASGTYSSAQTVTITDATSGAAIYYTTNGSTPTSSSAKYTGPITVSTTETIQAVALATGYTTSSLASATYTISSTLPAPIFSLAAGTYTTAQSVAISDSIAGATIYYTTNGTTPTTSSTKYAGAITVSATETIKAIAVETGYSNSAAAAATYTIATVLPNPSFSVAPGTYSSTQTVAITDTNSQATIYFTTTGTPPTTTSAIYTSPLTVSSTETIMAMAAATGYTNSAVASAAYTIDQAAKQVDLTWDEPASSPDPVAGYNVYRATGSSSVFQLLNSSVVTSTTYVDSTVQSGTTYSYYVESVDAEGMQSVPSNQTSVSVP